MKDVDLLDVVLGLASAPLWLGAGLLGGGIIAAGFVAWVWLR